MMLDPAALEALEAVVDCGSVAAAAARLNKATSAISYHLRRLEERLNTRLLDRGGYRLALTPEGEAILAEARPVLRKLREMGNAPDRSRQGWEPRLRIVYEGSLPTAPIIGALDVIEQRGATTRIELSVGFLGGVEREFDQQQAEVLISATLMPRNDLDVRQLAPLGFTLCCGPGHALANAPLQTLQQLQQHTELVIPGGGDDKALYPQQFHSHRIFRLSDFHTKLSAIRQGLGYGWLPDTTAVPSIAEGSLCQVNYENGAKYSLTPTFASRAGQPKGNACRAILAHLLLQNWQDAATARV